MKTSDKMIWEMNAKMRSAGNVPVRGVCIIHEMTDLSSLAPRNIEMLADKEDVVGRLFNMSLLGKYIQALGIASAIRVSHCILDIYIADSGDGSTNIDGSLIEAVSQLKWCGRREP